LGEPAGPRRHRHQETYDLTGTNYYNPNWGYVNGEKRARESRDHKY
jgi:hypothetical protein